MRQVLPELMMPRMGAVSCACWDKTALFYSLIRKYLITNGQPAMAQRATVGAGEPAFAATATARQVRLR